MVEYDERRRYDSQSIERDEPMGLDGGIGAALRDWVSQALMIPSWRKDQIGVFNVVCDVEWMRKSPREASRLDAIFSYECHLQNSRDYH
jgi:hypothetical protein